MGVGGVWNRVVWGLISLAGELAADAAEAKPSTPVSRRQNTSSSYNAKRCDDDAPRRIVAGCASSFSVSSVSWLERLYLVAADILDHPGNGSSRALASLCMVGHYGRWRPVIYSPCSLERKSAPMDKERVEFIQTNRCCCASFFKGYYC